MSREDCIAMSDETMAKLVYAAVGAALDCHATPEQIKRAFRPEVIDAVVKMIKEKKG